MTLLSLTLALFLIMDPLGNVKAFAQTLEGIQPERQRFIIAREMLIALFTMIVFDLLGESIFQLLQISLTTVFFSSGIILFITAVSILFPRTQPEETSLPHSEPFLVPLAIPMVAGPALLATIMLYAGSEPSPYSTLYAILIAWGISAAILMASKPLLKLLGQNGLVACEKMMGMVLILLAVDRILLGVVSFIHAS